MTRVHPVLAGVVCCVMFSAESARSQNWPQWRGLNRDAKTSGFRAPNDWPKELSQKWKVTIGDGVATPALVDNKLFVFTRVGGNEAVRALNTSTGDELWKDEYAAQGPSGGAAQFPGPRSSPTYVDGKLITMGVHGTLTCYDAAAGKVLWRNETAEQGLLQFAPSSSPIVSDGLCIAQIGSEQSGAIVAYDLATGEEKWKWTKEGPGYASPVVAMIDGVKAIVAATDKSIVALNPANGTELWKVANTQGRYNSSTPIIQDTTVIYAGPQRGMTSVALKKQGDELAKTENWRSGEPSLVYNTPVLRDGWLYGISSLNAIFCANATTGESAWSSPIPEPGAAPAADGKQGQGGKGGGGRRGGGGGGGYGSVVDAGNVLAALNPTGQLIFFVPNSKEFQQLALYKVADGGTYAYPILSGNRVFIKDKDSIALWTLE